MNIPYELLSEQNTPFFAYDLDTLAKRADDLRETFSGVADIYFAVKANPNLEVLKALRRHVAGLDIASGGEFVAALDAGFEPADLSWAGPAKSRAELLDAAQAGAAINVESLRELEFLTSRTGHRPRVRLRLNPRETIRAFASPVTGGPSPFGIDVEELGAAAEIVRPAGNGLEFLGIHIHAGSQNPSAAAFFEHVVTAFDCAEILLRDHGLACRQINLGGGFGASLDARRLAQKIAAALPKLSGALGHQPRLILEPGRYLAGPCGVYGARVIRTKLSRGKRFAILDGGINHLLGISPSFQSGPPPKIENVSRPDARPVEVTLVGPACTALDVLARDVVIAEPAEEDLLLFHGQGAYGWSLGAVLFLSHPSAQELLIQDGKLRLVRPSRYVSQHLV